VLRVGVDVGGTNTDAVLMDGRRLLAAYKTPTTADVESGVVAAIGTLLHQQNVAAAAIGSVMIGTTQFTNAFVERRRLIPIGVIRIGLPATTSIPPLYDWPRALLDQIGTHVAIVGGGYEFDGRDIAPLDEAAVVATARGFRALGLRAVAISCVFAPVNASMEQRAADIVRNEMPDVQISISSAFGRIGLIERENATAMNACLGDLARTVVGSFRAAIAALGIAAPFYISQNDGTLMSADEVERRPVMTFASGPTNSMRGAAFLSGLDDAIVLDVGGTTSDIGTVVNSFPRESAVAVDIGGVRTNFRMPDLISRGLGGGSLVRQDNDGVTVGPQSVGYRLTEQALVFGGSVLTATDIVVAAGAHDIGDRTRVAHLAPSLVNAALAEIRRMVEEAVDRIKTSRQDVPLILVGGGSILVSGDLAGTSRVIIPENFSVANAVGAAIAQVGGEVDSYFSYETDTRENGLNAAKANAIADAVKAGADPASVRVVDIEEVPLGYLPSATVRVRVKAIGDLQVTHAG
jgi:N-methylhydantoinase A/oxoprolinase/acetone carboxylase beta subunit